MKAQLGLDLAGGESPLSPPLRAEICREDPMPPGPYSVGLCHTEYGDMEPFTICCGDGRAIAGHVNSRACADAIVAALNHEADWQERDAKGCYDLAIAEMKRRVAAGEPVPSFMLGTNK